MKLDDMIIVSVDDHVVEPPDLFERHLPDKFKDIAPHVIRTPDGSRRLAVPRHPDPQHRAQRGRRAVLPRSTASTRPSFEEIRAGCFDIEKRILDMNANGVLGSLNFPSLPGFAGRLFGALDDKAAARVLTEAYNDWHIDEWCGTFPGRFIPLAVPAIWDPEVTAAEIRRVAKKGCHAVTFPENPVPLGPPEPALRSLGPGVEGVRGRGDDRVHAHRLVVEARGHRARRAVRRHDRAPADEHRAVRRRPRRTRRSGRSSPTSRSRSPRAGSGGSRTSSSASTTRTARTRPGPAPTSVTRWPASSSWTTSCCASSPIRSA